MKNTFSHLAAFVLGVLVGALAVSKGCPPWPVPADHGSATLESNDQPRR